MSRARSSLLVAAALAMSMGPPAMPALASGAYPRNWPTSAKRGAGDKRRKRTRADIEREDAARARRAARGAKRAANWQGDFHGE